MFRERYTYTHTYIYIYIYIYIHTHVYIERERDCISAASYHVGQPRVAANLLAPFCLVPHCVV